MKKTVLITGCSSGFGKLAARTFYERGWNVVASMRSPEKEAELSELEGVLLVKLDVTDPGSIRDSIEQAIQTFGTIHVLVNNAGYGGHALFEQASDSSIRAMYDTNVFGVMNVSREVLPLMRAQSEGCVINVTSMAGMMAAPTISVYASSKHAVQGLTEGMAFEYRPFGIKVKSVLPGAYPTTRFNANTDDALRLGDEALAAQALEMYEHIQGVATQMAAQGDKEADPQEVADKIYECATEETPVHNPVGGDAQMLASMMGAAERQGFLDQMTEMLMPPSKQVS